MTDAKKVSFNQETAKSTEGHNDRSMYKWGYSERSNNMHWDMYGCGSSVEAEARFYKDTFGPTLEAQNDRARKMRKHDRVMDMKTWHKKHPLKEAIVQLGDVENNDTSREFARGAAQVIGDAITAAGGIVVSIDLHDDERTLDEDGNEIVGTPHLHIRYVFLVENKDGNLVIDMKNALLAHGIDRPDPSKPTSKTNNPAQTFLETTRTLLEDYADELELKHGNPRVDRDRTKRAHSSVQQYKGRKRVEELEKKANQAIATRDAALAEVAEERQKLAEERQELADERRALERERRAVKSARASVNKDARDNVKREASLDAREGVLASLRKMVLTLIRVLRGDIDKQLSLEEIKRQADVAEIQTRSVTVTVDMSDDEPEQREDERTF